MPFVMEIRCLAEKQPRMKHLSGVPLCRTREKAEERAHAREHEGLNLSESRKLGERRQVPQIDIVQGQRPEGRVAIRQTFHGASGRAAVVQVQLAHLKFTSERTQRSTNPAGQQANEPLVLCSCTSLPSRNFTVSDRSRNGTSHQDEQEASTNRTDFFRANLLRDALYHVRHGEN